MSGIWGKARKKPIIISYRKPIHDVELITTREGEFYAYRESDYVIMGVDGEIYPIGIDIFNKTYEILRSIEEVNR